MLLLALSHNETVRIACVSLPTAERVAITKSIVNRSSSLVIPPPSLNATLTQHITKR